MIQVAPWILCRRFKCVKLQKPGGKKGTKWWSNPHDLLTGKIKIGFSHIFVKSNFSQWRQKNLDILFVDIC